MLLDRVMIAIIFVIIIIRPRLILHAASSEGGRTGTSGGGCTGRITYTIDIYTYPPIHVYSI